MKKIYGEIRAAVGENDDDPAPEGRLQVLIGNVVVFEFDADVSDIPKLVMFGMGIIRGLARVPK